MSDISRVESDNRINDLYNQESEVVEQKKETVTEELPHTPAIEEQVETVAQETIAKAEVTKEAVKEGIQVKQAQKDAPVQKVLLPAVKLKKITRDDIQKKDAALVKAHIPTRIKEGQWDKARNVVVIKKSGKERVYGINNGAAPALFEGKHSDVIAYLNKM